MLQPKIRPDYKIQWKRLESSDRHETNKNKTSKKVTINKHDK